MPHLFLGQLQPGTLGRGVDLGTEGGGGGGLSQVKLLLCGLCWASWSDGDGAVRHCVLEVLGATGGGGLTRVRPTDLSCGPGLRPSLPPFARFGAVDVAPGLSSVPLGPAAQCSWLHPGYHIHLRLPGRDPFLCPRTRSSAVATASDPLPGSSETAPARGQALRPLQNLSPGPVCHGLPTSSHSVEGDLGEGGGV